MMNITKILIAAVAVVSALSVHAQESSQSSAVRRGGRAARTENTTPGVTQRMQQHMQTQPVSDADMSWMKVLYRSIDLTKDANAPLYFPEQPVEGSESLFRIIMRLLANDEISAYEYLDGREVFSDQYKIKVRDMLDRFHIYYQDAKGSNEKHPKFQIEESDVPANEVLSYYIIERWEFDNRTNRMRTRVEAICPVLHRSDDFGMESVKYPMFWIKFDDIRPYLSTQNIFVSDYNNMPSCTYDDYFQLGLYQGDIYKTRNLRNKSMAQLYPEPEDLKRAQDSIQNELDSFDKKLWVPSLEELEQQRELAEQAEAQAAEEQSDSTAAAAPAVNSRKVSAGRGRKATPKKEKKATKVKKPKKQSAPKTQSAATRSVRNRKK